MEKVEVAERSMDKIRLGRATGALVQLDKDTGLSGESDYVLESLSGRVTLSGVYRAIGEINPT